MDSELLNLDQSPERLEEIHGEMDYYYYLRSPEFLSTFIKRIGDWVNEIGLPVLDVACGEAYLYDYVHVPYVGFDGSSSAIRKARLARPGADVMVGRIEDPPVLNPVGTLVFGGLLGVLVLPPRHIQFTELYRRFYRSQWLIVYDLSDTDTSRISEKYDRIRHWEGTADLANAPDRVRQDRKLEMYRLT